jgi:hypothetical protein
MQFELLSTLKIRELRHSGLDPKSPQARRDDPSPRDAKGILNHVQDDTSRFTVHPPLPTP